MKKFLTLVVLGMFAVPMLGAAPVEAMHMKGHECKCMKKCHHHHKHHKMMKKEEGKGMMDKPYHYGKGDGVFTKQLMPW